MRIEHCLLVEALRRPEAVAAWTEGQWDVLVRQARRAALLPRLALLLREAGGWEALPEGPRRHLSAGLALADKQLQAVGWELHCIREALAPVGVPVVLLKGAAYVAAGLPPAKGRLFSDVDILVPKAALGRVEAALMLAGWGTTHLSDYDQRYYRRWMHEIPPMQHRKRLSVIDVHHAILPGTSRTATDPAAILEDARALPQLEGFHVPCPEDLVLHSATHLFHEGELPHGLRDLVDLDALLRHFAIREGFWDRLTARAQRLNLTRPLFYALRYTRGVLGTPVPEVLRGLGRPGYAPLMDWLFDRGLAPQHATCDDAFTPLARWLLYVRGHWLRMPLYLLIPHLLHKAFTAREEA